MKNGHTEAFLKKKKLMDDRRVLSECLESLGKPILSIGVRYEESMRLIRTYAYAAYEYAWHVRDHDIMDKIAERGFII